MRHKLQRFRKQIKRKSRQGNYPHLWFLLKAASDQPQLACIPDLSTVEIEWAEGGERARKVIRRSNHRATYKYPSRKCVVTIHCESFPELNAATVLDACPEVNLFREQPAKIHYQDASGVERVHYPDFHVVLHSDHQLFIEIKADKDAEDEELLWRTQHLTQELAKIGFHYLLVFESQVSGDILDDADLLLKYAQMYVTGCKRETMRLAMGSKAITVKEALEIAGTVDANSEWMLYSLVYEGAIQMISQNLNSDSLVIWR